MSGFQKVMIGAALWTLLGAGAFGSGIAMAFRFAGWMRVVGIVIAIVGCALLLATGVDTLKLLDPGCMAYFK